jgi:hypothetical protein
MKAPRFPSWQDLGLPDAIPDQLKRIRYGDLLNFLVDYRVFLQENEVKYLYLCGNCGYQKPNFTPFETYSECRRCGGDNLNAIAYFTLHRKNSKPFNKNFISLVCSRMTEHHKAYCDAPCENVMEMTWDINKGGFAAKFMGGDKVYANDPILVTLRAALCCPFLWDGRFDLVEKRWKEQSGSLSFSHLIYQWCNNGKFAE